MNVAKHVSEHHSLAFRLCFPCRWVSTSPFPQCKADWEKSRVSYTLKRQRRSLTALPLQDRKFIDRRRVRLRGGSGGNGCVSFRR